MRDRIVLWVLVTGFAAALLVWHLVGHWLALGVGLIAVALACLAYRVERPRIDLDHPEEWGSRRAEGARRIDQ